MIERAVIVSDTDGLSVDELWLVEQSTSARPQTPPLEDDLLAHEKARVEAALMKARAAFPAHRVRPLDSASRDPRSNRESAR